MQHKSATCHKKIAARASLASLRLRSIANSEHKAFHSFGHTGNLQICPLRL
jgi:hypothetical protein